MFILFIIESWTHLKKQSNSIYNGISQQSSSFNNVLFLLVTYTVRATMEFPKRKMIHGWCTSVIIVSYKREFVKSHPKRHMGYYGRTLMLILHHSLWQDTLVGMKVYRYKCSIGKFSSDNLENFEQLCYVFHLTLHQSRVIL